MSDLTGKFGGFESDIAANHAEIMTALGTITTALGGTPTGTFADLVNAITETNTLLTSINYNLNTKLTGIANTLDIINSNASLNAQRILSLMLQTACPCDDTVPLLPIPIDPTVTTLTAIVKCQRIQYFLDLFRTWCITMGSYLNSHGSISSYQVQSLLDAALAEVDVPSSELNTISISTRDNISQFLNTVGTPGEVNAALIYALTTSDLMVGMRQALYANDNAIDGKAAADTAIGASSVDYPGLIVAMLFSSWVNVMYSDAPIVDASAYDGEICSEDLIVSGCWSPTIADIMNVAITNITTDQHATYNGAIIWPSTWPTSDNYQGVTVYGPIDVHSDLDILFVLNTDLYGYWVVIPGGTLYDNNEVSISNGSTPTQITVHTTQVFALNASTTFQLCRENPSL
jgi:hypothetical protein